MGNARHSRATICKGLVEAHGGRIWAASGGAGQGTQITFTLPATGAAGADAAPDRATRRPHAPPKEPVQMPILVVDDDPQTLRYVRDALAGSGYSGRRGPGWSCLWNEPYGSDSELVRTFVKKLVNERGVGYRMARPGDP